jgi:hypothetical protein
MSQSVAASTIDFQGFSRGGGSSTRHETRHGYRVVRNSGSGGPNGVRWTAEDHELKHGDVRPRIEMRAESRKCLCWHSEGTEYFQVLATIRNYE